jgi:hypothetical protein
MPAILSKTVETSTTTGTGNFTLSGAATTLYGPNARTFSDALDGSAFSFYYDIFHQSLAEFERGIGYLSSGALVRSLVIESSNSNALVNFSAGDKVVMSAAVPDALEYEPLNVNEITSLRRSMLGPNNLSTQAATADRLIFYPYFNSKEIEVTNVAISVTSSGTAGHLARIGLFEKSGNTTFRLIYDFGTVPVDTATDKLISFPFKLPVGAYYFGVTAQSSSLRASGVASFNNFATGAATSSQTTIYIYTTHAAGTAFSSTYTASFIQTSSPSYTVFLKTSTGLFQS